MPMQWDPNWGGMRETSLIAPVTETTTTTIGGGRTESYYTDDAIVSDPSMTFLQQARIETGLEQSAIGVGSLTLAALTPMVMEILGVNVGVPGGQYELGKIAPGGAPFRMPDLPTGEHEVKKKWWTGTAWFVIDQHDHHWVSKKVVRDNWPDTYEWKKYSPKKPTVIGNKITSKNINKTIRLMKRYKGVQKNLNKLMPRRTVRRK